MVEQTMISRQDALTNLEESTATIQKIVGLGKSNKNIGFVLNLNGSIPGIPDSEGYTRGYAELYLVDDKGDGIFFRHTSHRVTLANVPSLDERVIVLSESPIERSKCVNQFYDGFWAKEEVSRNDVERMYNNSIEQIKSTFSDYKMR